MPGYKGHIAGGLVMFGALYAATQSLIAPGTAWWLCALTLAGALFPDVDTKSKGQKWLYRVLFCFLIGFLFLKKFVPFAVLALLVGLPLVVDHRGLFHRLWFIALLAIAALAALDWYHIVPAHNALFPALFFIAGAASHLMLDIGVVRFFRGKR